MIKIVTHTRGNGRWFEQCVQSVEAARVPDMEHEISIMSDSSMHANMRWNALQSAEFVGFVDDDDLIMPGAIKSCMAALEKTGAGVAFTNQIAINGAGVPVGKYRPARMAVEVALDPQSLHHFALIRRSALCSEAFIAGVKYGVGIDWLCKANAAMRMGAVHVPMIGYHWRRHPEQESVRTVDKFSSSVHSMRELILSWMPSNFKIPTETLAC